MHQTTVKKWFPFWDETFHHPGIRGETPWGEEAGCAELLRSGDFLFEHLYVASCLEGWGVEGVGSIHIHIYIYTYSYLVLTQTQRSLHFPESRPLNTFMNAEVAVFRSSSGTSTFTLLSLTNSDFLCNRFSPFLCPSYLPICQHVS